jgi:phage-related protein
MATFPSINPTYAGFSKRSNPNKRLVRFQDGYEHRIVFGLASHQNPKIYSLIFDVTETESDVIEAFLDSRANDQASFTFTPPAEGISKTGTYSQSGTTVTMTVTNHGIAVGETVTLDFTTGSATDGTFIVASAADQNTFTTTAAASATNSGNVSVTVSGAGQYVCESWTKSIPYNNRAKLSCTFREVFEP